MRRPVQTAKNVCVCVRACMHVCACGCVRVGVCYFETKVKADHNLSEQVPVSLDDITCPVCSSCTTRDGPVSRKSEQLLHYSVCVCVSEKDER